MAHITVINPIHATHNGPMAPGPSGLSQEIHLLQGSLDGACGPYSLIMSLLICGVIERDTAIS